MTSRWPLLLSVALLVAGCSKPGGALGRKINSTNALAAMRKVDSALSHAFVERGSFLSIADLARLEPDEPLFAKLAAATESSGGGIPHEGYLFAELDAPGATTGDGRRTRYALAAWPAAAGGGDITYLMLLDMNEGAGEGPSGRKFSLWSAPASKVPKLRAWPSESALASDFLKIDRTPAEALRAAEKAAGTIATPPATGR